MQGRNHEENLGSTSAMVGKICPHGWGRVKVSANLGATAVTPVAPADTSLYMYIFQKTEVQTIILRCLTGLDSCFEVLKKEFQCLLVQKS